MKIKMDYTAVSEIIGVILLLAMAILVFSFIYINVFSEKGPAPNNFVNIIGKVEGNNLVLEHQRGESLRLDTEIMLNIDDKSERFLVKEYLDQESIKDGKWNIGERIIYPISLNISNIRNHFACGLDIVDYESNSLVFWGTLDLYPKTDIGVTITADTLSPIIGSKINLTIIATNNKQLDTPAINIEILYLLPDNLLYINNVTSRGFYNLDTSIWNISYLESGESVSLTITAIVKATVIQEPTQFVMILDGSTSISSSDWNLMRTGLANSIKDPNVFPNDGSVELTVIQFGQKDQRSGTQYARIELGPIIVTKNNYISIGNTIQNLPQLRGYTPMSCGIYLAADSIIKSQFLNSSDRQVICLVTDGQPNCSCDPKTYTGRFVNDHQVTGRISAEQGRNYLINTLNLTPNQDEFDCIAVGNETNTLWLKNKIVWPEPGNYAPPYNPGWVCNVSNWQDFSETINDMFRVIFSSILNNVKIIAAIPITDPNLENNEVDLTLIPIESN